MKYKALAIEAIEKAPTIGQYRVFDYTTDPPTPCCALGHIMQYLPDQRLLGEDPYQAADRLLGKKVVHTICAINDDEDDPERRRLAVLEYLRHLPDEEPQ